jgi:hypothetical protein
MHAKVRGSHPFCRYFCRYRKSKPSERISLLPNERIEQAGRKNDGANTKAKSRAVSWNRTAGTTGIESSSEAATSDSVRLRGTKSVLI